MAIENQTVKWVIVGVLAVLLVPVIVTLGMMAFGVAGCCGMMSNMVGMMGGMTWGFLGVILIAALLIAVLVVVIRGDRQTSGHNKAA